MALYNYEGECFMADEHRNNGKSGPELLMEYKMLLDRGAITQEEFDARKSMIFGVFQQMHKTEVHTPKREVPTEPVESRADAMMAFWKGNLTKLWNGKKEANWNAYFAPYIPLQICSNAIFNITNSRERKEQILAVLDCTPDVRVPCGRGVVITEKRMYINLLNEGRSAQKYPPAVLVFDQLKSVWSGVQKGPLWSKWDSLFWETKAGELCNFGPGMYPFLNYHVLEQLLNSSGWKNCLEKTSFA